MNKEVLDKIVNTANEVLQNSTPLDKQIKFCETIVSVLEKTIPEWYLGQGFDTYRRIYNSGCGDDFRDEYIKPCWGDFSFYYAIQDEMWISSSRDWSEYRFAVVSNVDELFYDLILYDVFRNEKERLEQIKAIEGFNSQLDAIKEQTTTSTQETQQEAENEPILPDELDTPYFKNVIKKAVREGFIEKRGGLYKWIGTRLQLAYFGVLAKEKNNHQYLWKPIETLFRVSNLAQEKFKNCEYRGKVSEQDRIDTLFE